MEKRIVLNQYSGGRKVFEDGKSENWSSQYFWDFLTQQEGSVEPESEVDNNVNMCKEAVHIEIDNNMYKEVVHIEIDNNMYKEDACFVDDFDPNTHLANAFQAQHSVELSHEDDTNTSYVTNLQVHNDTKVNHEAEVNYVPDYDPFIKATERGDWTAMDKFIKSHPQTLGIALFSKGRTALHYALHNGREEMAARLVDRMKASDLEIGDNDGVTALGVGAFHDYPGVLKLLKLMVSKNPNSPHIGALHRVPVMIASWKGYKETTRYLYGVTHPNIFNPNNGILGVQFLNQCINIKLFDIASEIVMKFPDILHQRSDEDGIYPIHALAKTLSAFPTGFAHYKTSEDDDEPVRHQAGALLRLVCRMVKDLEAKQLEEAVHEGMIEAAKHGNIEFVAEMVRANPDLIRARDRVSRSMFWHAVVNRQEKVFNLIYDEGIEDKDSLLSWANEDVNNILHFAAMLPETSLLDRTAGPALQMQRELQWFMEVRNVAKARYREDVNKDKVRPRALFTKEHEKLVDAGEKAMKDTAQSATTVGALIVTVMFAVAFTVPGGNDQNTGFPLFVNGTLFKIFIVCDALSLFSSATSLLIFLGILASRYSEQDFLLVLPRKLITGFSTLFLSITTMMLAFCAALTIMLDGRILLIGPIILLSFVPVLFFMSSIFPLLSSMYKSTFGPSIFDKNVNLLGIGRRYNPSSFGIELPDEKEDVKLMYYSYSVDKSV